MSLPPGIKKARVAAVVCRELAVAFMLVGVKNVYVADEKSVREELEKAVRENDIVFVEDTFHDIVKDILEKYMYDPSKIIIEIPGIRGAREPDVDKYYKYASRVLGIEIGG